MVSPQPNRAVKRINGIDVEFRLDGRDELPWVTFVTGIANDLSMWDAQAAALERDFRVLRYDLRGQGGTQPTPGPYSVEMLVQDLIGLLDGLNIRKTSLVGLGLGGALVQAAAVAHPDRVHKLAPSCCRAKMVPEFAKLWHGLIETVKKDGFRSIVEPTAQRWFSDEFKAANPAVMDKVRRMIKRTSVQGYLEMIEMGVVNGSQAAAATHNGAGVPANCNGLVANWAVGGTWATTRALGTAADITTAIAPDPVQRSIPTPPSGRKDAARRASGSVCIRGT